MKIDKLKISKIVLNILILYVLWNYIFTMTNTSWFKAVYYFMIFSLFVIVSALLIFKPRIIEFRLLLWFPFLVMVIYENIKLDNYEGSIYFLICFIILLLSKYVSFNKIISLKLFSISGFIIIIGILFQIIFPGIYNDHIATFFKNTNDIIYWSHGYGYAGFSYQLGVTAIILLYCEGSILYAYDRNRKNYFVYIVLIVLFILLSGKRTITILAILLPLIIFIVDNNIDRKKLFNIILALIVLLLILYFFLINVNLFIDSKILGRFATTIIDIENGIDASSNRVNLYNEAFNMLNTNKAFGIGLGQFKLHSAFSTDVHNTYLQILCEQGIVGFVLYIVPLALNLFYTIHINKQYDYYNNKFSLFIQLFIVLYGITGNVMVNEICYIIYFISICMIDKTKKERFLI